MRNLELSGRSPVHGTQGMASTSNPLSTLTAVEVLKSGGNAMDAAIAACAVQCVVEPESTGIGGDCFCLYTPAGSDKTIAFNGSGKAPEAATPEWYAEQGITKIERQTPHSVTVPSAIDGWDKLLKAHGTKEFVELLRPAIGYARDGYPVGSRVSVDFASQIDIIRDDENLSRVFLKDDKTPAAGSMHRQPELANTLEAISSGGRDAFYTGEIAQDMVDYLRGKGGLLGAFIVGAMVWRLGIWLIPVVGVLLYTTALMAGTGGIVLAAWRQRKAGASGSAPLAPSGLRRDVPDVPPDWEPPLAPTGRPAADIGPDGDAVR